jgi:hypothetical protein
MIQGGKIGEAHFVRVWNYIGMAWGNPPVSGSEPPSDLDWDA